jgi:hypothetical protein
MQLSHSFNPIFDENSSTGFQPASNSEFEAMFSHERNFIVRLVGDSPKQTPANSGRKRFTELYFRLFFPGI